MGMESEAQSEAEASHKFYFTHEIRLLDFNAAQKGNAIDVMRVFALHGNEFSK